VDLNCGCPAKSVTGKGAGSSLLRHPEHVYACIVRPERERERRWRIHSLRHGERETVRERERHGERDLSQLDPNPQPPSQ
jgi:hypothetical protein